MSLHHDDGGWLDLLQPEDAQRLREYLLKGGFLWADDFWGTYAWDNWASEFSKVLPPTEYPMRDLPRDHALFRTQFTVERVPQIPSINHWYEHRRHLGARRRQRRAARARGHRRQGPDAGAGHLQHGLGDSWEREGDDKHYFYTFSVNGYAFGINTLLYAMTH